MTSKTINTWQGLMGFVGITAGVIPLIQFWVVGSAGSVWRWLFDGVDGTLGWVGPLTTAFVAVVLITVLERRRKYAS
ncbi:hypothetical protein [Pseudonocardia sp. WMMC193]|uniref:hypothetical protein n=1 Tax=Pseudonocardia sp. WMMC193 TaxID=2911965 RepID=UPI001F25B5BE|nr:hypothetical protein [Pseudonocardia sp. WMMC193]MCF7550901.1 hypothetical protein [Pseudonocardia sp. WMMC193]